MISRDLDNFFPLVSGRDGPRVSDVGDIAHLVDDKHRDRAAAGLLEHLASLVCEIQVSLLSLLVATQQR